MWKRGLWLVLFIGTGLCGLIAQELRSPLDIPIYLSGNFGELRSNHFHSGIDYKTQGVEGKPIYAIADGYINRVVVSPWGYGKAIYVTHTSDRLMSVYAHLQRFTGKVGEFIKLKQYEKETFSVDLMLDSGQFPVRRGDVIGYSGNSGSSGGPHLHFEIRDTQTGEPIDPLPFYKKQIKDAKAPKIKELMVYPIEDEGIVNQKQSKQKLQLVTAKDGKVSAKESVEAWGKIGFSLNIDDFMDGTSNVYGVKEIVVEVDKKEVFRSYLDRFSFEETRYLNAWIDYEIWKEKKTFFTKTFVEPGNRLHFIKSLDRGYVQIDEPRDYTITFRLADEYGNTSSLSMVVQGKKQPIQTKDTTGCTFFDWSGENRFGANGVRLEIPRRSFYKSFCFKHQAIKDTAYLSDIHMLHNEPVPLHKPAQLSLRLLTDTLNDTSKYGIISLQNKKQTWLGGTYREGWLDLDIKELGSVAASYDTTPPKITPVEEANWIKKGTIAFRLVDNLSGLETYRGEIDGEFALFELDGKKSLISYELDEKKISRGKHVLIVTAIDACGNSTVYETLFSW